MSSRRVIIAGAGLAGLSAAVVLAEAGVPVSLSDSAAQAGGRCRSYPDPALGLTIDNGNHLVLSGNPAVAAYRKSVGAQEPLSGPDHADFAFADLSSGGRWTVRINDGRLPWWTAVPDRRVPGTSRAERGLSRHPVARTTASAEIAPRPDGAVTSRAPSGVQPVT